LLTRDCAANSLIGWRANAAGSLSTSSATRCSAGAKEGRQALMRSSMAVGGLFNGSVTGLLGFQQGVTYPVGGPTAALLRRSRPADNRHP
jgi:hypothetical protein